MCVLIRSVEKPRRAICYFFFFNDTAPTDIYTTRHTLSLHDALPIFAESGPARAPASERWSGPPAAAPPPRRSEEHTSELHSRLVISYAVFCFKKKKKRIKQTNTTSTTKKKKKRKQKKQK